MATITLQQLRILTLIAKYATVSGAAKQLQLKQPTVSFHMRKLEESAGVGLFEMKQKRVFLTDAGRALLAYAVRIVSWTDDAGQVMRDYRQHRRGKLAIGASNTPATYVLPQFLERMRTVLSDVRFDLQVRNSPEIIDMIKACEIDFGIIADHDIHDPDLEAVPLLDDEMGLVLHPVHPLAGANRITAAMLRGERWIVREKSSASRRMFDQWENYHDLGGNERMELGSTESIKKVVRAQQGVAILSGLAVMEEVAEKKLVFRSLDSPFMKRKIYLIYMKNRYLSPLSSKVIGFFLADREAAKSTASS